VQAWARPKYSGKAYTEVMFQWAPHLYSFRTSFSFTHVNSKSIQVPQLSRRDRAAGWVSYGQNWKTVSLLVINSNWHPISWRFGVIAAYCSNFGHFAFLSHPWGGLRDNVRCPSWAHWKAHSGLPISVNWTFFARSYGWGATGENRSKIGDFAPAPSLWPKLSFKRGRPTSYFWTDS